MNDLEDFYVFDELTSEQLARLNPEQKEIVLKREERRKYRLNLINSLNSSNSDNHEMVFNALMNEDDDRCEHDRSIMGTCIACHEIDVLLFPEYFDVNGDPIDQQ